MERGKVTNAKEGTKPKENKEKNQHPLEALFLGKKVVIQGKGARYSGTLIKVHSGLLHLINATIIGTRYEVKTDIISIAQHTITHIHTPPTEIKEIQEESKQEENK